MRNLIEKYPYLFILLVWFGVYALHLNVLYPNIMEARNFITAREMLIDGNWLLTTMDGLPRYEKPPLPTWFVALFGHVFGLDNIAALRFPSALVTLFLMCMAYNFSQKLSFNKRYSLLTALILGTSFYVIFAGRNGTWDIFAHAFMLSGIYCLFQFFETQTNTYKYALFSGVFIGLSFMGKGPVSHYALLLPFLIAYGFVYRYKNLTGKLLAILMMLIIIGVLSSWWAYYIYVNDLADATRIAEKESSRWVNYEVKSFFYYWSFFTQSGIWTILAFVSLLYPYLKSRVTDLKVYKFVLLWTLASVVLLSLIPTKKSRYLLPVLIPLAFAVACYAEYLFRVFRTKISKWERFPVYFNFGLIGTIGIVFPVGAYMYFGDKLDGYYTYYILASITLFVTGVFIWYHLLKRNFSKAFYANIIFIFFIISSGFPLANSILGNPAYNSISKLKNNAFPVYAFHGLTPELVWDYGKVSTRKTQEELLTDTLESPFGVLTSHKQEKDLLRFLDSKYEVEFHETFDLNPVDSTKRGYKDRLKADYYIVKKRRVLNLR